VELEVNSILVMSVLIVHIAATATQTTHNNCLRQKSTNLAILFHGIFRVFSRVVAMQQGLNVLCHSSSSSYLLPTFSDYSFFSHDQPAYI
jgi:hypothetical protein